MISEQLKQEAGEAFHAYEKVFIDRIVRREGWRLDAAPLAKALDSGDEATVRAFIKDMVLGAAELRSASIAW
ncbi:MAG: hypothetical protein AB7N73_06835 [Gemmatimonadales bacterium]